MSKIFSRHKKIHISSPSLIDSKETNVEGNISLVCKHDFLAQHENQITVKKGEFIKLLDRRKDDWLLVKYLDKIDKPGLILSSYVDIAYNDAINPITQSWLNGKTLESIEDKYFEFMVKRRLLLASAKTINNEAVVTNVTVNNCLYANDRYWYRVDINFTDESHSHICRYYQDFYELHASLLNLLFEFEENGSNVKELTLPRLPNPVPSSRKWNEEETKEILLQRCVDLQKYLNGLLSLGFLASDDLLNWFSVDYKDSKGVLFKEGAGKLSEDKLNQQLCPNSINIFAEPASSGSVETSDNLLKKDNSGEPTMLSELPRRQKSTTLYNHYHQVKRYNTQKSNHSHKPLKLDTSIVSESTTSFSDTASPAYSISTPDTTNSDSFYNNKRFSLDYVKCKIIKGNNEIIAIKLDRLALNSIEDLKNLVSKKVFFSSLYIKDGNFIPLDESTFHLNEFLSNNEKLVLKAV